MATFIGSHVIESAVSGTRAVRTPQGWAVSWLPDLWLTTDQALMAVEAAELLVQGAVPGSPGWPRVVEWLTRLEVSSAEVYQWWIEIAQARGWMFSLFSGQLAVKTPDGWVMSWAPGRWFEFDDVLGLMYAADLWVCEVREGHASWGWLIDTLDDFGITPADLDRVSAPEPRFRGGLR